MLVLRVEVEWIDSGLMSAEGWQSREELISNPKNRITTMYTVGFLMHEDKEAMYVALTSDREHGHFYAMQVIAKSAIKSVTILRARKEIYAQGQSASNQEDEEGVSVNS